MKKASSYPWLAKHASFYMYANFYELQYPVPRTTQVPDLKTARTWDILQVAPCRCEGIENIFA